MHSVEARDPVTRADVWAVNNTHCLAHYQLLAEAEPDVLCRVLNHFALQFLVPQQVSVVQEEDLLSIEVVLGGLSWHRAQVTGEKLRNLINVCSVALQPAASTRLDAVQSACGKQP